MTVDDLLRPDSRIAVDVVCAGDPEDKRDIGKAFIDSPEVRDIFLFTAEDLLDVPDDAAV